nr:hypothetical protein [Bacteroidota bacterium]
MKNSKLILILFCVITFLVTLSITLKAQTYNVDITSSTTVGTCKRVDFTVTFTDVVKPNNALVNVALSQQFYNCVFANNPQIAILPPTQGCFTQTQSILNQINFTSITCGTISFGVVIDCSINELNVPVISSKSFELTLTSTNGNIQIINYNGTPTGTQLNNKVIGITENIVVAKVTNIPNPQFPYHMEALQIRIRYNMLNFDTRI